MASHTPRRDATYGFATFTAVSDQSEQTLAEATIPRLAFERR